MSYQEERDRFVARMAGEGGITVSNQPPPITPLAFGPEDFERAERMAEVLGYTQTAYTSSSALWGLFCLPENPRTAKRGERTRGGCIIKTAQFGLLFVQDEEDAGVPQP